MSTKQLPQVKKVEPKVKGKRLSRLLEASGERFGLRLMLSLTVILCVIGFGAASVSTSYRLLYTHKTQDVWAILFLELEHRARELADRLIPKLNSADLFLSPEDQRSASDATVYEVMGANLKLRKGRDIGAKTLSTFGVTRFDELAKWNLAEINSSRFLVLADRRPRAKSSGPADEESDVLRLIAIPYRAKVELPAEDKAIRSSAIYIASRQGRMVYSNQTNITEANFQHRVLVQRFIKQPLWQGQIEFEQEKEKYFGFFTEVPGTNLVIFAETAKSLVTTAVAEATGRLLFIVLVASALTVAILQIPLIVMLSPFRELIKGADQIARGNFQFQASKRGFGELRTLSKAFQDMAFGLDKRDATIKQLMVEQEEKMRLQAQFEVAKNIQDNLLPTLDLPIDSAIRIAATYEPAGEVAGDWFGFYVDPATQDIVTAIVDISGKGAGASMFTAIAASVFEAYCHRYQANRDPKVFFDGLNRQLLVFGKGAWTASCQVVVYETKSRHLIVMNAGHPPPFAALAGKREFLRLKGLNSPILGISMDLKVARVERQAKPGEVFILYTDGLSERRTPEGAVYGLKRIAKDAAQANVGAPGDLVRGLAKAASHYARGEAAQDDTCIIALQIAA